MSDFLGIFITKSTMGSYIMSVIHKTYQVKAYKLLEISKSHVTVAIIGNDLIAYEKL